MVPRPPSPRWLAAAACAGVLGGAIVLACSSFGGADTAASDAAVESSADSARSDDAAIDADATAADPVCDGGVHYAETFDGVSDVSLFHGFMADDFNSSEGRLVIASTDTIDAGLTGPFLLATATLRDGGPAAREAITRLDKGRPSHVTVAFDVGLGASDTYAEYGCGIFLRSATDASDSTLIDFESNEKARILILGASSRGVSKGSTALAAIPSATARHVILQLAVSAGGMIAASATLAGKDGMVTQNLPPFQATSALEATQLSCGILFSSAAAHGGSVQAGIDNIDVTICP